LAGDQIRDDRRVKSRDIPRLLELLTCGDAADQADTLTLLCPCRNVRYDREVWAAIFHAAACSQDRVVRDRAAHAIGTLKERARTDPRSQELVRWLVDRQLAPESLSDVLPVWQPRRGDPRDAVAIPAYERPVKSRHRRQRR